MSASIQVQPEEMAQLGLVSEFRSVHHTMEDRAFAFVLGAGASKSSGIKTASEMVSDWVGHLHVRSGSRVDCKIWAEARTLGIGAYDPQNAASAYPALYQRVYRNDPARGYAYLEHEMRNAEPSYGYSVLARILASTRHKVVVTTNFDNLVADSLSIFSTTFPLVCGHETLTPFVRSQLRRPLVVKVHRDLLLQPKSNPDELASLPDTYARALDDLFAHYTPIVVGYGGNDGSLMGYLSSRPQRSLTGGVYWCYWEGGDKPDAKVCDFVAKQGGYLVPISGFDDLMLLLGEALEYDVPDKFVLERARERADRIVKQVQGLKERLKAPVAASFAGVEPTPSGAAAPPSLRSHLLGDHFAREVAAELLTPPDADADRDALRRAIDDTMKRTDGELRWWQWEERAKAEMDPDQRDRIYQEATVALPTSAPLLGNFANFLVRVREDYARAEQLYERAMQADPNDANNLGNFANLLTYVRRDYARAEQLYERAIQADPNSAAHLGNFASFLVRVRKDYARAEQLYERAMEADPNDANNLGNFAHFELARGHIEKGLGLLERALALIPGEQTVVQVECWMYAYCHRPPEQRTEALRRLKELVDAGIRTGEWDYSGVIAEAVRRGHDAAAWLPKLADVLADRAPPSTLDSWDAWATARA